MSYIYTDDPRMLNKLFRQGYRDMKRFGYDGLGIDMPLDYYEGVSAAAIEIAQASNDNDDDMTWL